MNFNGIPILIVLIISPFLVAASIFPAQNYIYYHQQVIESEKLIADKKYREALLVYENIFNKYDFIFVRDYKVATQLALQVNDSQKALYYLKKGMAAGWSIKSIRRNKFLTKLWEETSWKTTKKEYRSLHKQYEAHLDQTVRKQVKKMFAKDQWKALGAIFTFSSKKQDRYAERKFAPHSEKQLARLIDILNTKDYPGEKLIGNNYWIATILSHHNSISETYVRKDTLYPFLKPRLLNALNEGKMSPWEFAMIDDWYRTIHSDRTETGYGYLDAPKKVEINQVNERRQKAGLNSIETLNSLIDIENQTGMDLYLPGKPWLNGKIQIEEH